MGQESQETTNSQVTLAENTGFDTLLRKHKFPRDEYHRFVEHLRLFPRLTDIQQSIAFEHLHRGDSLISLANDQLYMSPDPIEAARIQYVLNRSDTILDFLGLCNIGLVSYVVRRIPSKDMDEMDKFQVGYEGLLYAIKNYDPKEKKSFSSYAYRTIRGYILNALRDAGMNPPGTLSLDMEKELEEIDQPIPEYESKDDSRRSVEDMVIGRLSAFAEIQRLIQCISLTEEEKNSFSN